MGHGRSNSFDRMIALEPFRRSASGRNKLPTYLNFGRNVSGVSKNIKKDNGPLMPYLTRRPG